MASRESIGLGAMTLAFVLVVGGVGGFMVLQYVGVAGVGGRSADTLISRGRAAANRRDYVSALEHLGTAIENAPHDVEPYLARADIYYQMGDYLSAQDDYGAAANRDPDSVRALMGRATSRERTEDFTGALEDYGRLLAVDPGHTGALRGRARLHKLLGDYPAAVEDFERAIAIDPGMQRIDTDVAWAYWGAGDYVSALDAYDRAVTGSRAQMHDQFGRGVTLFHLGQLPEAREELMRAKSTRRSGYSYAAYYLWLTMVQLGERQAADTMLRQSNAAESGDWSGQIGRFLLGEITEEELIDRASAGTWQPAEQQLCEAHFYAGAVRLLEGDRDAAANHFSMSVETGVNNFYEFFSAMEELRKLGQRG